ncbi:MAG: hypothetical protein ABI180_00700 [Microcoleus sp.]
MLIPATAVDLLQKSSSPRTTADIGQMQHRLTQMVSGYFRIFAIGLVSILIIAFVKVRMSRDRLWFGSGRVRSNLRIVSMEFAIARSINTILDFRF